LKYSKILLILTILLSVIIISCKNNVTDPKENSIIGKWQITGLANKWMITTSSDQLVKIPYSGSGQITSFGSYNSVFNGLVLQSSDPFVIAAVELEYGMVLTDAIVIDGVTKMGKASNSNTDQTFEGIVNYSFNGTTLTITESILTNPQNATETVTVNGSISFITENVPANTQTYVSAPDIWITFYYTGPYTTEYFTDGTVSQTRPTSEGDIVRNGTWSMSDDMLTVNMVDNNETTTKDYNVIIDGSTLAMTESFNICSDGSDKLECLNGYEQLFGLDAGSMSDLGVEVKSIFNKRN